MTTCKYCGKEITGKSHKPNTERKYCSQDCFRLDHNPRSYGIARCMFCGEEFRETRDRPNKFCSNRCASLHRGMQSTLEKAFAGQVNPDTLQQYREALERVAELTKKIKQERRCLNCGSWFCPDGSRRRSYCSERCARAAENARHDKRLQRNGKADRSITLTKLYMRDGGVCQICGRKIDFDCDSNSDFYPSIDHIRPLAKGGLHRWDNVQLACRICNSLKADDWEEE